MGGGWNETILVDGQTGRRPAGDVVSLLFDRENRQYRAFADFLAKLCLHRKGYLLDFREGTAEDQLPKTIFLQIEAGRLQYRAIPFPDFRRWIADMPSTDLVIFVCDSGNLADEAAGYARKRGYRWAYTLSGRENE